MIVKKILPWLLIVFALAIIPGTIRAADQNETPEQQKARQNQEQQQRQQQQRQQQQQQQQARQQQQQEQQRQQQVKQQQQQQQEQQRQQQQRQQQDQVRQQQLRQQQDQQQQQVKQQQDQQRQLQMRQQQEQQKQQQDQLRQQQGQQKQQQDQLRQQQELQRQQGQQRGQHTGQPQDQLQQTQDQIEQRRQQQDQLRQQQQQPQGQQKQQQDQIRQQQDERQRQQQGPGGLQQQDRQNQDRVRQQQDQTLGRQPNPGQQQPQAGRRGPVTGTPKVLSPQESQQRLQQLNQQRSQLGGINRRPLPTGQVTALPNGHEVIQTSRGSQVEVRQNGALARVKLPDGRAASFHPNGQIRTIQTPALRIDRGLRGDRRIESDRGGVRLVSEGRNRGYEERPYTNRGGRVYVERTYWVEGRRHACAYREDDYRGEHYYRYVPVYYYHPAFYYYVYRPWNMQVRYDWGWNREPWHEYYSGYYAPEPVYSSPLMWLTDFLMIENLRLAYEARQDAEARAQADAQAQQQYPQYQQQSGYPASGELSPELKAAIAAEVQRQLEDERAAAQQPPPPPGYAPTGGPETPPDALNPSHRLFVVSNNLTLSTIDGNECELSGGDLITRLDDTPGDDGKVRVSVMTSKQQDCAVGTTPLVTIDDLQEMHNDFRQQVDSGMQKLAVQQGQSGMPGAPDVSTTPSEVPPPPPDGNVDQQLQQQQVQAGQVETQVQQDIQYDTGPDHQ